MPTAPCWWSVRRRDRRPRVARTSENSVYANFAESPKGEVRRILIPRTWVNKGIKRVGATIPWPFLASRPPASVGPGPSGQTILAFYTTGRRAVLIMANESEEKRQRFLGAACEVAVTKGDPSASVHVQ